jgi:dTDP-glucose 4,6-dehydratase
MKNILVTGGAGFIGSNFIHYLLRKCPGVNVFNLDALTYAGNRKNLDDLNADPSYAFINGNICQREWVEKVFTDHRIDTVVHFAAESHVDRSIFSPMDFIQTNIVGTSILLDVAREVWLSEDPSRLTDFKFHHVSTDEVYGSLQPSDPPFSETTAYAPNSPYAASKAASDLLVRAYHQTYQLPITISNCSNNYGPYQFPEKLVPLMILNAIEGKPLPVYGDGLQIRDWLYVEDHCEAILTILKRGRTGETYNIGGNNQPTNLEIIHSICTIMDELFPRSAHFPHDSLIHHIKDRPGHDRRYAMDITKIKAELGWSPHHTLHSGLKKTVKWYLKNSSWVNEVQNRPSFQEWMKKNYEKR